MRFTWIMLIISLFLAAVISLFASSSPDGLERVAENLGFLHHASSSPALSAPLPNYTIPGLKDSKISGPIAGIIGVLICFFLPYGFFLWRKK